MRSKDPQRRRPAEAKTGPAIPKGKTDIAGRSDRNRGTPPPDEWGGDFVRQGRVSGRQTVVLLSYLMGTKVLYLFPTSMATRSGNAAWLSLLISSAASLLGLWGWLSWVALSGNEGFVASLRRTCGRLLGDLLAATIAALVTAVTGWSIRLFAGGAVIGVVPEYPIEALVWTSVATGMYAAWLGIESVARAAGFFFVPTLVSFLAVAYSFRRDLHVENLLPFWGLGAANTVVQGLATIGTFGGLAAVGIIKSYVRRHEELTAGSVKGLLLPAAVLIVGAAITAGAFPYPMSTLKADPLGAMARAVYLGRFIQRIEIVFIFVWFFASAVQVSFLYVLDLALLSQLSNTGTYRPFVPAVGTLTFALATIPANTLRAGQLVDIYFTTTAGTALVFLGWVLYGVGRARGLKPRDASQRGGMPDDAA